MQPRPSADTRGPSAPSLRVLAITTTSPRLATVSGARRAPAAADVTPSAPVGASADIGGAADGYHWMTQETT